MSQRETSLEKAKDAVLTMVAVGCDREMAAKVVGWTTTELRQVLADDPQFATRLLQAEGKAEFHRMRNLHQATREEKNWRAATWWLERRAQRRYDRRHRRNVTTDEIQEFIDELVELVFRVITREDDRERFVTELAAQACKWESDVGGPPLEGLLLEGPREVQGTSVNPPSLQEGGFDTEDDAAEEASE